MSRKHNDLGEALSPSIHGSVAGQLADAMQQKNITKGEAARAAQDQPSPGESAAQSKPQSLAFQPETGGGHRRATSEYRAGVENPCGAHSGPLPCGPARFIWSLNRRTQHLVLIPRTISAVF